MNERTRPEDAEHPSSADGGADPDELPDGSGSDGGRSTTAEGGDDDQFQG